MASAQALPRRSSGGWSRIARLTRWSDSAWKGRSPQSSIARLISGGYGSPASADLSWPVTSAELQTALASCSAEQSAIDQANSELAATAASAERDDANAIARAEQTLRTAEDAAAVLRATDPQATLANVQAEHARAEDVAHQADAKAQLVTRDLGLAPNRAAVEAERGRIEERLRTLESQIAARPMLSGELASWPTRRRHVRARWRKRAKRFTRSWERLVRSPPLRLRLRPRSGCSNVTSASWPTR